MERSTIIGTDLILGQIHLSGLTNNKAQIALGAYKDKIDSLVLANNQFKIIALSYDYYNIPKSDCNEQIYVKSKNR